jgi:hypothetical protein
MSSDFLQIEKIAVEVVVGAIFAYGAYWAFAIRRALASRDYRRQALWLGVVCLYWIALFPDKNIFNNTYNNLAVGFYYSFLPVLLFVWIDASVRVARRSDPLLRNTLHWNTLRLLIWAVIALATFLTIILNFENILTGNPPSGIFILPFWVAPVATLISGSPAILLSAIRSRDTTFRRSLKWFGMFIVVFLIGLVLSVLAFLISSDTAHGIISVVRDFIFAPAAYCLYRSARSLAPMDRLPLEAEARIGSS